METNYNSNRVHIFALILSQLTSNYQCDLDPALIQISRLKIKIRIKTVNIWKVWRILLPTVVYDSSTIDGNLPNISEGTIWSRSDNYRLSATQSDTIYWFEVFLKPFAKFSNCRWLFYLNKRLAIPKTVHDDVVNFQKFSVQLTDYCRQAGQFCGLACFAEETAGIKAMTQPADPLDCKTARIFCVFKYARTVKQKVWREAENGERDWEETFFRLPHTPSRFARVRLLRCTKPILRKKATVFQSNPRLARLM